MSNLFNHSYPYLDEHELNLDWIIAKMKELIKDFDEFKVVNNITFSGAWDITKQYPAWTIVSDNNIGYVSIQPVPVGVVLTNGDYWVEVIDYTAQIAGLESRVIALENTVGDASSGLVKDMNDAQADIVNLNTRVSALEKKVHRKFAFITDSYGDSSVSDDNTNIIYHFMQMMGLTNNVDIAYTFQGGAGFVADGVRLFSNLLTNLYNTIQSSTVAFNADEVTDLIVVGGCNDSSTPFVNIVNAVSNFITAAKGYFPNAIIHIGEVGNLGFTRSNTRINIGKYVVPAYQTCTNSGAHYLTGVELVMRNGNYLMSDDVHPTGEGMKNIAGAIKQALITAYNITYEEASVNMNLTGNTIGTVNTPTITAMIRKKSDVTQIFLAGTIDVPGGSLAANTTYVLGTLETELVDGYGFTKGLGWIQDGFGNDYAAMFWIYQRMIQIRLPQAISPTFINLNNVILTVDSALV